MKKAIILSIFLAPLFASVLVGIHMTLIFNTPYAGPDTTFTVKPGEGFASINYRLSKQEMIPNARLFHYYTKYYKDSLNKFKAGTYEIKQGYMIPEVLDTLVNGQPMLGKVTLPEGKNMFEIGKILDQSGITSYQDFINACRDSQLLTKLGIPADRVEGYLFPDTYKFAPGTPAAQVVEAMVRLFNNKIQEVQFQNTNLSKHQVITLASIVEKETGAKVERPTIAGVYLNRLKKNMRLQADPTTIYGIWESYGGNLKKAHLLQKTEYNTYMMAGLPKGPIASPSLAAIKAVIEPEQHNFLYFVSKNDGTHIFTPTYQEHLKAVEFWQRNPQNRKGKSWRDLQQ